MLAAANGAKNPKTAWFNRYEILIKQREAREKIPERAARIFWDLWKERKVPDWVMEIVDFEDIRLARGE